MDPLITDLKDLVAALDQEMPDQAAFFANYPRHSLEDWFNLFRGYCNVRPPWPASESFLLKQDHVLKKLQERRGQVTLSDAQQVDAQLYLWQGDMTRLAVDAIVNAANQRLLGCTQANHLCLDNSIHTWSGIQLRLACHRLIQDQGHLEPVGSAKITPAFNLPSRFVMHTVGPYIYGKTVSEKQKQALVSCYRACLELADSFHLNSLAFSCISTGVFHFPPKMAANLAIATVRDYLTIHQSPLKVVFNIYSSEDLAIYHSLLVKDSHY
ncbi:protein-ADP-ribose hydrolase [Facklamia hominis]|uniref:protein-ADP-ribose hydrolase n=1 Tax=Facklamia hominis TaxID=178214 RepID=UPI000354526E|nr:protein-ADP-ribose hydrolase [Facklamia hominis]EPH10781.1 hypothetical protein HMPREF9260_00983 [Facklamia hominis ACS-120-V-Sch10]